VRRCRCRYVNGTHYSRTLEDWLKLHDGARKQIMPLFEQTYGKDQVGGDQGDGGTQHLRRGGGAQDALQQAQADLPALRLECHARACWG
jgi:hypothetical protein